MSYKNFKRPEFVKELDKILNNISKCRFSNGTSKPQIFTSSEREYLVDIDDHLQNLQKSISDKKMTYV